MKTLRNSAGFTYIEVAVVVTIVAVMGLVGVMTYQHFAASITLDRSREIVLNAIDERRLEILNGNKNCAEARFMAGSNHFVTAAVFTGICEEGIPLVKSFNVSQENLVVMSLEEREVPLRIRVTDTQGIAEQFEITSTENVFNFEANKSMHYTFQVFNPEDIENTKSEWHLYYLGPDNININKVNHVAVQRILGVNPDLQETENTTLTMKFSYPDAKTRLIADTELMHSAKVVIEKEHSALDPLTVLLSNVLETGYDPKSARVIDFLTTE